MLPGGLFSGHVTQKSHLKIISEGREDIGDQENSASLHITELMQ